jgi:hypothetical protein
MTNEVVEGQIYKTNTIIPLDDWNQAPPDLLVRVVKAGAGLCEVETLNRSRSFSVPPGNLISATEDEIADGGPKMPPRRGPLGPIKPQ